MVMTAAPVAAVMPRGDSCEHLTDEIPAAQNRSEAGRIGSILAGLVPDGNVRAMEALAVVIIRSDWGHFCAAASAPMPVRPGGDTMRQVISAGERIARRALAGTLADASRGASRFHRVGDFPDWAHESRPTVQIGDFLFYRICEELGFITPSNAVRTGAPIRKLEASSIECRPIVPSGNQRITSSRSGDGAPAGNPHVESRTGSRGRSDAAEPEDGGLEQAV